MPVYRTPDGRIIEEKTNVPLPGSGTDDDASRVDETTATRERGAARTGVGRQAPGRYDEKTVVRRPSPGARDARASDGSHDRTRLVGAIPASDAPEAGEIDPVSGWFVVIEGPGKGRDVRIGAGRNDLGRTRDNRIPLPFGDTRISRQGHLWVTYDPLRRTFSVAPGEQSTNLAHLNGVAIDTRLPLEDGATITIGRTTLRFVAFCGDRFHWSDAAD